MIIAHPKRLFQDADGIEHNCLTVQCDKCNAMSEHVGKDITEAAENAIRFDNFRTARGKKSTDPRTWLCSGCHKKNDY